MPTFRSLVALLLGTALALPWSAQAAPPADVPHRAKPAFPLMQLPDKAAAGRRAVELLGNNLPAVAAHYGKSPDELRGLLLNDRRSRVDQRGRVFFVDEIEGALDGDAPSVLNGQLRPLEQTFLLHSKPGANRTVYLNFRGATLTGTAWNSNGNTLQAPAFDLDGIPGSFNTTELQRIQGVWQRVAEDFAPFDVNVTTEAPPADRLTRSGSSDAVFGTTVLVTTRAGVYSCSCGGVAYLGVFDDTSDFYKPALVFYDALSSSEKNIAEAASHEAGHNMGLGHDGTASAGYYTGHGSGTTGWAPIMGVGYSKNLVQWSKGEYTGANNVQDDYTVMQGNGLPLRADDHGNSAGAATVLTLSLNGATATAQAQGVIERPSDVDVFAVAAGAGSLSLTLSPSVRAANLDALVTVRNSAGVLLGSFNPSDTLNATGTVTLPSAGTYTVSVQGTGKGDPLLDGYTAYGSLGFYGLSVQVPTPGSVSPTAVISASTLRGTAPLSVSFSGAGSTDPDGSLVAYDWTLGDGAVASGAQVSHVFGTPGTYSTQLRVTDNAGLSGSTAVTVVVDAPVVVVPMRVADIAMGVTVARNGQARATADVRLVNGSGQPVAGAVVTGNWMGLAPRSGVSATTGSNGVARFTSSQTRATSGTFVFTVTGASLGGHQYQPSTNTETSDSIAR